MRPSQDIWTLTWKSEGIANLDYAWKFKSLFIQPLNIGVFWFWDKNTEWEEKYLYKRICKNFRSSREIKNSKKSREIGRLCRFQLVIYIFMRNLNLRFLQTFKLQFIYPETAAKLWQDLQKFLKLLFDAKQLFFPVVLDGCWLLYIGSTTKLLLFPLLASYFPPFNTRSSDNLRPISCV